MLFWTFLIYRGSILQTTPPPIPLTPQCNCDRPHDCTNPDGSEVSEDLVRGTKLSQSVLVLGHFTIMETPLWLLLLFWGLKTNEKV